MKKFVCTSLMQAPSMPAVIKNGQCVCGGATAKGMKACIMEHARGGLETDEISQAYATSLSSGDAGRGLHLA
eukprot:1378994-Alexandrium_andersonii.AAC.1